MREVSVRLEIKKGMRSDSEHAPSNYSPIRDLLLCRFVFTYLFFLIFIS